VPRSRGGTRPIPRAWSTRRRRPSPRTGGAPRRSRPPRARPGDPPDKRGRNTRGTKHAAPGVDLVARQELGHGRHIRRLWTARRPRDGQRPDLPLAREAERLRDIAEDHVDPAAQEVVVGVRAPR
jgi:hypothetical protein